MRLASSAHLLAAIACAAMVMLAAPVAAAAPTGSPPSRQEVEAAVERLRADPDLATTGREKTLRFKDKTQDKEADKPRDKQDLNWLTGLIRWLTETARILVWVAGALLVALLLVGLRRWMRAYADARPGPRPTLPSHVRSLDIRPESLPEAIGAAAARLWAEGQQLAALSLLYRGALSRLVHLHAVPIRAASTEGECVALAQARLDTARAAFVAQLVRAWQLAVYGARLPDAIEVQALCRDFDLHLSAVRATAGAAP